MFVLLIEALLSLYVGINWGTETAGSPGGKVAMSIVGVLAVWIACTVVDVIAIRLFSPRPSTYRYAPYTPISNQTREEALEAFKQRSNEKQQALLGGVTPEAFEAEQYERSRQQQQAQDDEFMQRVRKAKPLPPANE